MRVGQTCKHNRMHDCTYNYSGMTESTTLIFKISFIHLWSKIQELFSQIFGIFAFIKKHARETKIWQKGSCILLHIDTSLRRTFLGYIHLFCTILFWFFCIVYLFIYFFIYMVFIYLFIHWLVSFHYCNVYTRWN